MNYNTNTNPFDLFIKQFPTLVGFDVVSKQLEGVSKTITNYPPYNIKKIDKNTYVIELAVAGFSKQDIDIELDDRKLTIKGNVSTDAQQNESVAYIHRGIAKRSFIRTFTLADTIEIKGAELSDGMLKLSFENVAPEKTLRKIDVTEKTEKEK